MSAEQDLIISYYVKLIKKLAAKHQMGQEFSTVSKEVLVILNEARKFLRKNYPETLSRDWFELEKQLGSFNFRTMDPKWVRIIMFSRKKVNAKK